MLTASPWRQRVAIVTLLLVSSACGGAAPEDAGSPSPAAGAAGISTDVAATAEGTTPRPSPMPLPRVTARPLAPPRPCDGAMVLCVAVGGTGSGSAEAPYGRIQDAVEAAEPGAVVQVARGEYAENVVMRSGIALRGGFSDDFTTRGAAMVTTITGQGDGPTVLIDFIDEVEVEGFSVTGGTGLCFEGACDGGAISAAGNGLVIAHNRLFDNELPPVSDSNGAGLSVSGQAEIAGNVIEGNRGGNGAGMIAEGEMVIIGNVVRDNVSIGDHGGGAFLVGTLTLQGNLFEGNRVGEDLGYGWGGGLIIATEGTTFTASGNVYRANQAPTGGAGPFIDDGADGTMTGELVVGNDCLEEDPRGAVYVDALDASGDTGSVVQITNATIADNDCGSGINVEAAGSAATVRNSIITGNGPALSTLAGATASATFTLADEVLPGSGNLAGDPAFAGEGDYHLQSAGGRFDPSTGAFVTDAVTSPGVDAGDPADPVGQESPPHGDRINAGAYGGTAEASRSPGSPDTPSSG